MVGTVQVAGPGAQNHLSENQHKDKEKYSDHFQEKDVSHPAERFEKAANTACETSSGTARGAACRVHRARSIYGIDGHGTRSAAGCGCPRPRFGGRTAGKMLPSYAPSHADAYSQYPADVLRFHTRL